MQMAQDNRSHTNPRKKGPSAPGEQGGSGKGHGQCSADPEASSPLLGGWEVPAPRCSVILSETRPGSEERVHRHHHGQALGAVPGPVLLIPAPTPLPCSCPPPVPGSPFSHGSGRASATAQLSTCCTSAPT